MTYLDHAMLGRNAWWRYTLTGALACLLTVGLGLLIGLGLQFSNRLPPKLAAQIQSPTDPSVFFSAVAVMFGVLLLSWAAAARLIQAKRFRDVLGGWSWRLFGWGALLWLGVLALGALIDFAIAPAAFTLSVRPGTLTLGLFALLGLSMQTLAEEWIFRGWLTQALLLATRKSLAAAVLSGLAFGALHIPNGLPQALGAAAFGVATSLMAIRLGGIAFPFGIHLANNLFGAVIVVSAQDVFRGAAGVITFDAPNLMWWDLGVSIAALAALTAYVLRKGLAPANPYASSSTSQ